MFGIRAYIYIRKNITYNLIHFVVLLFFLDKELEVVGFDDDMIAAASS